MVHRPGGGTYVMVNGVLTDLGGNRILLQKAGGERSTIFAGWYLRRGVVQKWDFLESTEEETYRSLLETFRCLFFLTGTAGKKL